MTQEPTTNDGVDTSVSDAVTSLDPMSSVSTWAPREGRNIPTSLGGEDPHHFLVERAKTNVGVPVCLHPQSIVHAQARVVTCRACHAVLDPIAVLQDLSRDATWCSDMLAQKQKLNDDIQQLSVDLLRLKKRATRAESMLPLDFQRVRACADNISSDVHELIGIAVRAEGKPNPDVLRLSVAVGDALDTIVEAATNMSRPRKPTKKKKRRKSATTKDR